jgi:hypothetical protein
MKKLLLAAVACCVFATPSFADQLPKEVLGSWCSVPARGDGVYAKGSCGPTDRLVIGRNKLVKDGVTCEYWGVSKTMEVEAKCGGQPYIIELSLWRGLLSVIFKNIE